MDEEFDTSVDTSDVDTSADIDTSDVVDDVPEDIPEDIPEDESEMTEEDDLSDDIPEDESEMTEEDDLSEDIPEDVPEDEPEMIEEDDLSEDIPEDVPEDESEVTEEDDLSEDIPEDVPEDEPGMTEEDDLTEDVPEEQAAEDTTSDVDSGDTTEPAEDTQDELMDNTTTDEAVEDTVSDVDNGDTAEPIEDIQDEPMDDTTTDDTTEDTTSNVDSGDFTEPTEDVQDEPMDDATTDEAAEDTASDVDSGDTTENIEDTQDEPLDDVATDEVADDTTTEVDDTDATEHIEDAQDEPLDDTATGEVVSDTTSDVDNADSTEQVEDNKGEQSDEQGMNDDASENPVNEESLLNDTTDAMNGLSDYMNKHNYGPDDFDKYSQDPEWRDLQKKTFPDYELPPLSKESAYNQLSGYMNEHNYGADDFDTYSQDPKWRELQGAAFPDYELPPLNETTEDIHSDVDNGDFTEFTDDTRKEPMDDTATDEIAEDTVSDVDSGDSAEPTEDTQDEPLADTTTDEAADHTTSNVDSDNSGEQTDTQNETVADETNEFNDGTQDDPSKVLKRDELDLLKSGNDAINQRLEAQADDYRDKGMSEDEIRDRLAADKWNFQKEFLEDAFPGQDISPNVFNGLSENGSKDRIDEIENSDTLKNQLKKEGTDTISDNISEIDNQAIEDEGRSDGVSDSSKVINDVSEDESIKDLRNKFAAFLNKQDITANVQNDTKEVNKDVESAQKMIDDYCNNDLKGVLSDDKKAVRLGDTVEFQDDEDFAKGLGSKERAAGVNGYNNGKKSYVKNSGPHPKKTAIHEHNHQLSCNDTKDALGYVTEYKRGVSINGQDRQVNEALTELFTKKMMGSDYPANPNVGYRDNMLRMEKMESGFGTDVLKEAYYQNKPDLLKSKYESVMGEGSWEPFSKSFDDSLSKYSDQEIFDKREHYRKYGTNLQTATDIKRQNAITYANKCATLFALKSKGVN